MHKYELTQSLTLWRKFEIKFQALQVTSRRTAKMLPSKYIFKLHPPKINPFKILRYTVEYKQVISPQSR